MFEDAILKSACKAIEDSIKAELAGYQKPLSKIVLDVIDRHHAELEKLVDASLCGLIASEEFKVALKKALDDKLAKVLIDRMGGELEKQVNALKANPATRAQITLAIDRIIKGLSVDHSVTQG
jgi:hypothetical protein